MNLHRKRKIRFDPHSDERITEDGIPSMKQRIEALLRSGARLEVHRLATSLVQGPEESDKAYADRCEAILEHQIGGIYAPSLAECSEIFARGQDVVRRALEAAEEAENGDGEAEDGNVEDSGESADESASGGESGGEA